jgi:hypothetical protein
MDQDRNRSRNQDGHRLEARVQSDSQAYEPQGEDHWHVNLSEPWEIVFWSRALHCSEAQLRAAVAAVGARAGDVRDYLHELRS